MSRKIKVTTQITRGQFLAILICFAVFIGVFLYGVLIEDPVNSEVVQEEDLDYTCIVEEESVIFNSTPIVEDVTSDYPYKQDDKYICNLIYFLITGRDNVYEDGFKYYSIPQGYKDGGGRFPEVLQVYLYGMCKEYDLDYYTVLSLIERESGYRWDKTGDNGNSKGLMQIYEKWHKDRMDAEGVTDLYNPYGNIRVGLNLLRELSTRSNGDMHYVLMSYNMGESLCVELNMDGIYSSEYSREILRRAQEIRQELKDCYRI